MRSGIVFALLPHFWTTFAKEALADTLLPPRCASDHFKLPQIGPGVRIISIEAKPRHDYSYPGSPALPASRGLNFCQVKLYLTHETGDDISLGNKGSKDRVLIEAWLPLTHEDWNGRFQATGGGAFATGMFDVHLGDAIANGWAAVSTDGGHDVNPSKMMDALWMQNEEKNINWNLVNNFASRSPVEQILIGKSITEQYYGKQPHHSYWNGCSTGGRQGYAIAQRFPHLVDGILANAPAISTTYLIAAEFWPQLMMKLLNTYMSRCELEYYRTKVIEHCDMLDGVHDGILEDPSACTFDSYSMVERDETFECDGKQVRFTSEMAHLVDEIRRGPRTSQGTPLYYGPDHGVPLDYLANITVSDNGVRSQNPSPISVSWLKDAVLRDPTYNLTNLDLTSYLELFVQSSYELGALLNSDNPDLSTLRAAGTKMVTWHGLQDQNIPYQSTIAYRKKVEGVMGGAHEVDNYYRLFLAPGVQHCGGGIGPVPKDALAELVDWVEHEKPPETLMAETTDYNGELVTRNLCAWPAKSKYMGTSDAKRASSWDCVGGTVRPSAAKDSDDSSRAQQILDGLEDRLQGLGLGLSIS